jgi:hypothetical protein
MPLGCSPSYRCHLVWLHNTKGTLQSLKLDKNNLIIDDQAREAIASLTKGLAANTTLKELYVGVARFSFVLRCCCSRHDGGVRRHQCGDRDHDWTPSLLEA